MKKWWPWIITGIFAAWFVSGIVAPELMLRGPDTTVALPVGSDDRKGLVCMLALPSASAVIEKT